MTNQRVRTRFGELLEGYRKRAGLSQTEFARRMREGGYPHYEQRTHSHLIYNPNVRVYPSFFQLAVNVLGLSLAEQQAMLQAWLSLADEGIPAGHLEEESFGGSEG